MDGVSPDLPAPSIQEKGMDPLTGKARIIPKEATTGIKDSPCLVFGNGIEIETKVYAKNPGETVRFIGDEKRIAFPLRIGMPLKGTDVVRIHFLPETSMAKRANDPLLVSKGEKTEITLDCLEGFIALAQALKNDEIEIQGRDGDDFYLLADTNIQFAEFLKKHCGFRGSDRGEMAFVKKSEFATDEVIGKMVEDYRSIQAAK